MEQKDALEYLVGLGNPKLVEVGDRPYTGIRLEPIKDPIATPITVHTLTGLVDYFNVEEIEEIKGNSFIQIASPTEVNLYGHIQHPWKSRDHFFTVKMFECNTFPFGSYIDHEQFVIQLQSRFVQDDTTAAILKIVGNLSDENVKTVIDDGVSQSAHVKTGLRAEDKMVPNPVALRPYRTFPEIEQPASKFILRLKSGKGELPQVALFDADNGQWKLEAIQSIKLWLKERLPEMSIIA